MKKQLSKVTLALAFFTSLTGFGQLQPCNTYNAMEEHFKTDPEAKIRFENAQKELQQLAQNVDEYAKPAAFQYTIPVVFHVLHDGGPENISDAAIIAALNQVNDDFARNSPDTNQIMTQFKNTYINSDIKFMLAKKDPQGNVINGIVHHIDPKTNWSQSSAQQSIYWPNTWDPTKYLNIYIVANIASSGTVTGGGIIVGYTYLPGTWPTSNSHDAIVYRYSFLGTAFPNPDSRSLSHEIGHWLSLAHTFGNTNNPGVVCGNDGINDTPITKGNFSSCPAASTNTNYTCNNPNPGNPANYYQNVHNFMDYSSCPKNFTTGQTTQMRNLLASTVSNRQNLWQTSNLVFTDVNGTTPPSPIAEFLSTSGIYTVCAGGSLLMKDFSYNAPVTSYQWAADNGATFATPTASLTMMSFPNTGVYNVSLTVTNAQGSSTKVRNVVALNGTAVLTGPFEESFEAQGLPTGWSVEDVDQDNLTWGQTAMASYHKSYSYFIDGSLQPAGAVDILQMPMIDVKNNPNLPFEFAYAYARENSSQDDQLIVEASMDCGASWDNLTSLSASNMSSGSGGTDPTDFFPLISQWKVYSLSDRPKWINYFDAPSVLIRFRFIEGSNGFGNNLFIDKVRFGDLSVSTTGVNELTKSVAFSMFPNPADGVAFVNFKINDPAPIKISVTDLLGKEVLKVTDQNYSAGEHRIAVNRDKSLSEGIYFVNLSVNGTTMSKKLVVK